VKVAFATTGGTAVDEHFGRAATFAVWDITPEGADFAELRHVAEGDMDSEVVTTRGMGDLHEEAIAAKIEKLADCKIVYFAEIGGPSAAKLVRRGIMPLKATTSSDIDGLVDDLKTAFRERPTPWMRKALQADS
jgi:nitrogen fixation protein NifX